MSETTNFLAIDLGASSGRVIVGEWDGERFSLKELRRFTNGPIITLGKMHWDILRLWQDILAGIAEYAAQYTTPLAGIGIDSWAVDFGLLDADGELLGNPSHYRDHRTSGMPALVDQSVSPQRLYELTGIQRMQINTLYQLVSMVHRQDSQLAAAKTLLMIPDLLQFWMTGRKVAEYTNATTTQLFDATKRSWATELLDQLNIPSSIFPPVVEAGTVIGELLPIVRETVGLTNPVPVIATASHDTASAVAAVPGLDEQSAYISSGTWSLVGIEASSPILSERARKLNFTNEGGVNGTIRFLKNVGGLWLLQECQRQWQREGNHITWQDMIIQAELAAPLHSLIDPDAPDFLNPDNMPAAIRAYCRNTAQTEPNSTGAIVRCCLESLALKYRWVIEALEELTGRTIETIRIVGGGSQNTLLCQLTADACGRRVVAGPVEATALGNILVQAIATDHLPDIAAGRSAIAASSQLVVYEPRDLDDWNTAAVGFDALVAAATVV